MKINPDVEASNLGYVMSHLAHYLRVGAETEMNRIITSAMFAEALKYWAKEHPKPFSDFLMMMENVGREIDDIPAKAAEMYDLVDEAFGLREYLTLYYPQNHKLIDRATKRWQRRLGKLDRLLGIE